MVPMATVVSLLEKIRFVMLIHLVLKKMYPEFRSERLLKLKFLVKFVGYPVV